MLQDYILYWLILLMARFWGGLHTSGKFHPGKLACAFLHINKKKRKIMYFSITERTESAPGVLSVFKPQWSKSKFRLARPLKLLPTNKVLVFEPVSSAHTGSVWSAWVKQVCKDLAGQMESASRLSSAIQVQVTTTESEPHFLKAWIRRFLMDSGTEPKPLIFKASH